jgi:hypothetical protein
MDTFKARPAANTLESSFVSALVGNGDINYGGSDNSRNVSLTEDDKKRLKLMGITKAARSPFFQGKRIDVNPNFSHHVCYICGKWWPCEMEQCSHAVCVRVMPCCDPTILEKWTAAQRKEWVKVSRESSAIPQPKPLNPLESRRP